MATAAAAPEAAPAPKKGKGKKLMLILALLILLGAGGGAGVYFSGILDGGAEHAGEEKRDLPKLMPKGSKPKDAKAEGDHGGGESASGEGPRYESSYFQIEKEFTSNLKDSTHLVQIGLAVSTPYDEKVIEHLKGHELAVRSAVLMTLSETDEELIFTADGKKDLQKRLVKAINAVLKEKEGFGGVANVYFTNFIVQ